MSRPPASHRPPPPAAADVGRGTDGGDAAGTPLPPRRNPFRSARIDALRFRLDEGWEALWARFEALGRRASLVGPEGSGKTALLLEIEARLARQGFRVRRLQLKREQRRPDARAWRAALRARGPRTVVSVDGAEQLSRWRWHRLARATRRAGGLIVTSHHPGLLPTLHHHHTSPALLADLVAELAGQDTATALRAELERLFAEHHGNLRDCLRALYDRAARG